MAGGEELGEAAGRLGGGIRGSDADDVEALAAGLGEELGLQKSRSA
jgi:hypothetical protein